MPTKLVLRTSLLALSACDGLQGLPHGGPWLSEPEPCEKVVYCPQYENCVAISGLFLDDAGVCREEPHLGCRRATCNGGRTFASDPDGQLWQFPTRCIPYDWTVVRIDAGLSDAWSRCSSPERDASD